MSHTIIPHSTSHSNERSEILWMDKMLRKGILSKISEIAGGSITFLEEGQRTTVGKSGPLNTSITVHNPRFWSRVALGGTVDAGSSYMDGDWSCSNLINLIRLLVRNKNTLDSLDGGWASLKKPLRLLRYFNNRNTRKGSDANIKAHYDIGNDLFTAMLDPLMMYSSGVYQSPTSTLDEAAQHKCDLLIEQLDLQPHHSILEIGCGWGGLACYIAKQTGCKVTAITISRAQEERARQRVIDEDCADLVDIQRCDYRDITGSYDRIVSVEMIEAVGKSFYNTFFKSCDKLLADNGLLVLQAITIADEFFEQASNEVDFIKEYIFPGSCIPSLSALNNACTTATAMRLHSSRDYGVHYARTLDDWHQRIFAQRADFPDYDDRFWRMWEFYLRYCEGGFAERQLGLLHLTFAKPGWRSREHDQFSY